MDIPKTTARSVPTQAGAARLRPLEPPVQPYFSIYTYVWDIADEGAAPFVGAVEGAKLGNISVAVSYHAGKLLLPHNRRHHVYYVEDGAVYFRPSRQVFDGCRIKPLVSRLATERNIWREITDTCQKRGIGVTAWLVMFHNTSLGIKYPQYTTKNAFGDRYAHALCPSQPAVMEYALAMARDLASYPISAIEWESFKFIPFRHFSIFENECIEVTPFAALLLSLCFCRACLSAAKSFRVNGATVGRAVKTWLEQYFEGKHRDRGPMEHHISVIPGLAEYLEMRFAVVDRCIGQVGELLRSQKKKVIVTGPDQERTYTTGAQLARLEYSTGVDLQRVGRQVDAFEFLLYEQNAGEGREAREFVQKIHGAPGRETAVYFAVRPAYPDAKGPSDVVQTTKAILKAGGAGVSYYNYGLFERSHMDWIRRAIASSRSVRLPRVSQIRFSGTGDRIFSSGRTVS